MFAIKCKTTIQVDFLGRSMDFIYIILLLIIVWLFCQE